MRDDLKAAHAQCTRLFLGQRSTHCCPLSAVNDGSLVWHRGAYGYSDGLDDGDSLSDLPSSARGRGPDNLSNVLALPETLRQRSSGMVDNLELGTPLGRGSYGKVYKGVPSCSPPQQDMPA